MSPRPAQIQPVSPTGLCGLLAIVCTVLLIVICGFRKRKDQSGSAADAHPKPGKHMPSSPQVVSPSTSLLEMSAKSAKSSGISNKSNSGITPVESVDSESERSAKANTDVSSSQTNELGNSSTSISSGCKVGLSRLNQSASGPSLQLTTATTPPNKPSPARSFRENSVSSQGKPSPK